MTGRVSALSSPEPIEVDHYLASGLLASHGLGATSLELLGAGWDNTVWLADSYWAARFPRRQLGDDVHAKELSVLALLAERLSGPTATPVPAIIGTPSLGYPWRWWAAPAISGRELAVCHNLRGLETLAGDVGAFLKQLHAVDPSGLVLANDPGRRADARLRGPQLAVSVGRLVDALAQPPSVVSFSHARGNALLDAVTELLALAVKPARRQRVRPVLSHGDLHLRHLLVDLDGLDDSATSRSQRARLAGVIDFGDACLAEPLVDLSVAYAAFSGAALNSFFTAYGHELSEVDQARSRVLAGQLCTMLSLTALEHGDADRLEVCLVGLERAVNFR